MGDFKLKVIDFSELYKHEYTVENITCKHHWEVNDRYNCTRSGRFSNGLMFFSGVETTHSFTDKTIHFKQNDFCYFPIGIKYHSVFTKCESTSSGVNGVLINFQLNCKDGASLKLNDNIVFISDIIGSSYENQMMEIAEFLDSNKPIMIVKARLYEFLTNLSVDLSTFYTPLKYQKIVEGIKYIERNYNKKLTIKEVADYCYMSESHFRKLFHSYLGISPAKYINNLKINKAKILLKGGMYSIAEVSEYVGIDTPAYFSWFYKKHTGISPSKVLPD